MAGSARKPVIGITGPERGAWLPRTCIALGVRLAGGVPLQLYPRDAAPHACHGLIISGGHDVHPVLYSQESQVRPNYDAERDEFELAALRQGMAQDMPILGICRGAQLLNVACGGNLFQDLRPQRRITSHRRTILPLKNVALNPASRIADILGRTALKVNSLHNQAVDEVGDGLAVAGRDRDEIVQAIEHTERENVVGVQWHPEFLLYLRCQRTLFRWFVSTAARQLEHAVTAPPTVLKFQHESAAPPTRESAHPADTE